MGISLTTSSTFVQTWVIHRWSIAHVFRLFDGENVGKEGTLTSRLRWRPGKWNSSQFTVRCPSFRPCSDWLHGIRAGLSDDPNLIPLISQPPSTANVAATGCFLKMGLPYENGKLDDLGVPLWLRKPPNWQPTGQEHHCQRRLRRTLRPLSHFWSAWDCWGNQPFLPLS